jgi:hypothetical protein
MEGNPRLGWPCEAIPFLKRSHVEACHEEETNCIGDKLLNREWVVAQEGCLGTFFDAAK